LTKNLYCKLLLSRNLDKNPFITKKPSIKQGLPVRRKTLLTAGFISVLFLIAIAEACFVKFAQANPAPLPYEHMPSPVVSVYSPEHNRIYSTTSVPLTFNVSRPSLIGDFSIQYWLDGKPKELFTGYEGNYSVIMDRLSNGLHYVEVKATFVGEYYRKDGYIDGAPVWRINVAEVANSSGKIYFKVDLTSASSTPSPEPSQEDPAPSPEPSQEPTLLQETQHSEPFPTTMVIAPIASVAFVGAGLLVYLKKRKR
jgi:hypothetical protein